MTVQRQPKLTADQFLAWAAEQRRGRYELVAGEVVAMAPERIEHARAKYAAAKALEAGLPPRAPCEMIIDGVSVRIDDSTVYEPDVLVRCGERAKGQAIEVADPMILVEVISPSTQSVDSGIKLADYFRLASLRHYLVVDIGARAITHHRRDAGGRIDTSIVREGSLVLEPPGIELDVERIFAAL